MKITGGRASGGVVVGAGIVVFAGGRAISIALFPVFDDVV